MRGLDGGGDGSGSGTVPLGGDLTGASANATVVGLQGTPVSALAGAPGDVLTLLDGEWKPAVGGGGGPVPLAGDLSGTTAAAVVEAVLGQPATAATRTIWAEPNGDVASPGTLSTSPTTLANAIATVPSGGRIVLLAGDYPATVITTTCTIVGASQSSASASPATRFTGLVTVSALDVRFVGVEFAAGLTENSGSAGSGKTTLEQCTVIGATTVNSANTTTLELVACSLAGVTFGGSPAGPATLRLSLCSVGAIMNGTIGAVTVEARASTLASVDQTAAGQLSYALDGCYVSGSQALTAGAVTAASLRHTIMVGSIDATGSGPGTVHIVSSAFDRAGSVIPVGAEAGIVTRDTALEYLAPVANNWDPVPTELRSAVDQLAARAPYQPDFNLRITDEITSNPPGSPTTYLSLASAISPISINPAGVYVLAGSYTLQVSASNTETWVELQFSGAPSLKGPFVVSLGTANAQAPFAFYSVIPGSALPPLLWFDLNFAKNAGTGDVTMRQAYLSVQRIM